MFRGFAPPRRQIDLQHGPVSLRVWPELGGSVAHYRDAGRDLFRPTAGLGRYLPTDLSCFPLLPYSNRIAGGVFGWQDRQVRLVRNHPELAHPIHGIGWIRPWDVQCVQHDRCRLRLAHAADEHWPWSFEAGMEYQLDDRGLSIALEVRNLAGTPMPCGLGQHPFLPRPEGTRVRARVAGVWQADAAQIPTQAQALPPQWDLTRPGGCVLDRTTVDHCFHGLQGAVEVFWPDGCGLRCTAAGMRDPQLILYRPGDGDFVCVEIVTHRPDAVHGRATPAGGAMSTLGPGGRLRVEHRFERMPGVPAPENA